MSLAYRAQMNFAERYFTWTGRFELRYYNLTLSFLLSMTHMLKAATEAIQHSPRITTDSFRSELPVERFPVKQKPSTGNY